MCILEIERTSECFDTSTKDNCVNNCCQSSEKCVYDILLTVLILVSYNGCPVAEPTNF
jgi:hypothetical protein